jgi:exosome complex component CSL4
MSVRRMANVEQGESVVPGDQLCVIEELMPGFGTYEKAGVVYAATAGWVSMDLKGRSISVSDDKGTSRLALPVRGDVMVGEVVVVYDQRAEVNLVKRNDHDILSGLLGEIHISNVTRRYVKSMQDVLKPGDIVRGASLNTHEIPVHLTLVGPELGVLVSNCSKCGNRLTLTTYNNLICLRCENRETREVANDYGQYFGLEVRQDLAPRRRSPSPRRYDDRRGGDRRSSDHRNHRSSGRRYGDRRNDRRQDDRRR